MSDAPLSELNNQGLKSPHSPFTKFTPAISATPDRVEVIQTFDGHQDTDWMVFSDGFKSWYKKHPCRMIIHEGRDDLRLKLLLHVNGIS